MAQQTRARAQNELTISGNWTYDTIHGYRLREYGTELDQIEQLWYVLLKREDTGEYVRMRRDELIRIMAKPTIPAIAVVKENMVIQNSLGF